MGFFKKKKDFVSNKDLALLSNNLAHSFTKVKYAHDSMLQKIEHLHTKHDYLKSTHDQNMELIKKWINYFNHKHSEHDKKVALLSEIMQKFKTVLDNLAKIDEDYIRSIIDSYVEIPKIDKDSLKKELLEELQKLRHSDQEIQLVSKDNDITRYNDINVTRYNVLTHSERLILALLFDSTIPLSYLDIANKLNMNPNTVKVYINSLKHKGIVLEEHNAPNKIKLYAISNKEKIKKFYNF